MTSAQLFEKILAKRSFLCVGLDSDISLLPECVRQSEDSQFEFNRAIIDATAPYSVCYKPNLAFYEDRGAKGWVSYEKTCRYIRENYPDIFIIADAKRGDIGNTSAMYARAFFANGLVDAVTLSPYMGRDTYAPFLEYKDSWAVILGLTSNPGSADFQLLELAGGKRLYQQVIQDCSSKGTVDNMMFVVGATKAFMLSGIREIIPDHFLLVPGVGAQGGSLADVAAYGMNDKCGLLVNSSRGIIFADKTSDYARTSALKARELRDEMDVLLEKYL